MKRHLIVALCAGIGLAGCVEDTGTASAPQGTSGASKLSMAAIGKPKDNSMDAMILHHNILVNSRAMTLLEKQCGVRFLRTNYKNSYSKQIKELETHQARIPQITNCYAQNSADAWDMRMAQLSYVATIRPSLEPSARVSGQQLRTPLSLDYEILAYRKALATAPSDMRSNTTKKLRKLYSERKGNRESWANAFNKAAPSFGNTLNSPTSQSTSAPVRTASLYPTASPAAVIAMDNMDRTVFGDTAVNKRMLDEAARAGRASIARQSSAGSSITLTQSNYCSTERTSAGRCLSYREWEDKTVAASQAATAKRRAAALDRRSAMAAESQRLAAERAARLPECHKFGCR